MPKTAWSGHHPSPALAVYSAARMRAGAMMNACLEHASAQRMDTENASKMQTVRGGVLRKRAPMVRAAYLAIVARPIVIINVLSSGRANARMGRSDAAH